MLVPFLSSIDEPHAGEYALQSIPMISLWSCNVIMTWRNFSINAVLGLLDLGLTGWYCETKVTGPDGYVIVATVVYGSDSW